MVSDLNPPSSSTHTGAVRPRHSATHSLRAHASSSHQRLTRAEHEAQFEREHGSLWIPGILDRLSLPLTRFHE
jgi:hypothetical protein